MPVEFHFRPEFNLVICVHKGTRTDDEFLASSKALYKNKLFNVSMNRLIDMRQADSTARSTNTLQELVAFVREQFEGTGAHPKVAVVAPKDLSFGIARMYEIYTDKIPWDLVVFRAVDAALAWLGLPDDVMDDID